MANATTKTKRRHQSPPPSLQSRQINLPDIYGNRCYSSKGWLLVIDKSLNLYLINPVGSLRIDLPHIFTIQFWLDYHLKWKENEYDNRLWLAQVCFIIKFAISGSPTEDDFTVVVIHHASRKLAYYKPGFKSWVFIDCIRRNCCDVICYQGKFYALQNYFQIYCIDISRDNTVTYTVVAYLLFQRPVPFLHSAYLVEALGKFFVICRRGFTCFKTFSYGTNEFRVYEVDLVNNVWLEVNEIGSVAFFLGDNSSFSIEVLESSALQANCIYFTDDCVANYLDVSRPQQFLRPGSGKDLGVYNLLTKTVVRLPLSLIEEFNPMATHIWIERID